jgi:hypothetical protein
MKLDSLKVANLWCRRADVHNLRHAACIVKLTKRPYGVFFDILEA